MGRSVGEPSGSLGKLRRHMSASQAASSPLPSSPLANGHANRHANGLANGHAGSPANGHAQSPAEGLANGHGEAQSPFQRTSARLSGGGRFCTFGVLLP